MGLDLTAIKEVVIIEDAIYDETTHEWKNKVTNEVIEDELYLYANPHFKNHTNFTSTGVLAKRGHSRDFMDIRAGSYTSYGAWRYAVARMFGNQIDNATIYECPFKDIEGAPFNELLNFSDCDGTINGDYLRKIQQDFTEHYELAKAKLSEYDFITYCKIKSIFDFAAPNGAVIFA